MSTFIIEIPEIHWSKRKIEASTIEEAFAKAAAAEDNEELALVYSFTADPETKAWTGSPADKPAESYRFDGQTVTKA